MNIELTHVKISDLYKGYIDSDEEGVKGYGGLLDIRPKYQREFIYKDDQRAAVIDTVLKGFPLNVMYWAKNTDAESGKVTYEVLDGQQRTLSICQFLDGAFAFDMRYFHSLQEDEQAKILNYELTVYQCEGTDSEKLQWFKTINIAGVKLTDQELRNAVYAGPWLTLVKRDFSKLNGRGLKLGEKYISTKDANRQAVLEEVLSWISRGAIENYMSKHQQDNNTLELWGYYTSVIEWVQSVFSKYRKEMKGLPWGEYYNQYKDKGLSLNHKKTEEKVTRLMADEDVTKKKGIYLYLLSGDERSLSIRTFSERDKRTAYEKQKGICPKCGKHFEIEEMEADHITPWSKGGKTVAENCQMLCKDCNRRKSNI